MIPELHFAVAEAPDRDDEQDDNPDGAVAENLGNRASGNSLGVERQLRTEVKELEIREQFRQGFGTAFDD